MTPKTEIEYYGTHATWREVADAARTTIRQGQGTGEPSSAWKKRILLAEHSPIRLLTFRWKWTDLRSWVSVHIVRHKVGIDHFVSTQRTDRTGQDRNKAPQDTPVNHECIANAQAIMTISRKRLCRQASLETRSAWQLLIDALEKDQPELLSCCVPECVYRGFCPEFKSCGYTNAPAFKTALIAYHGGVKDNGSETPTPSDTLV